MSKRKPSEPVVQQLMTVSQVTQLLNVHYETLRRWEKEGKLLPVRLTPNSYRRYRREDIENLMRPKA